MIAKVQKWGISFPEQFLENMGLQVGDDVDVNVTDKRIVIEAVRKSPRRYRLKDLVKKMPEDYHPKEENWGVPVGREVW